MKRWTPVLVIGLATAAASALPAQQRPRCRDCDTANVDAKSWQDYARAIERLRGELMALQRRQTRLTIAQPQGSEDSIRLVLDPNVRRVARELSELEASLVEVASASMGPFSDDSLRRLLRDAQFLQVRLQSAFQNAFPSPKGWLGISYSAEARQDWSATDLAVKHASYPVIVTVEPGSPAERAGLSAGDTMVSFNGTDLVEHEISMSKVLRPGSKLVIRVHRDGDVKDIPVVVGRRPEAQAYYRVMITPDPALTPMAPIVAMPAPAPGATPAPRMRSVPPSPEAMPLMPAPAATPVPEVWTLSVGKPVVAGAELARVDPDLGEAFGVDHGVLILSVAPATPAEQAGLRAGDVILRADTIDIRSPGALQRAVLYARGRPVSLSIIRKRKARTLTLSK